MLQDVELRKVFRRDGSLNSMPLEISLEKSLLSLFDLFDCIYLDNVMAVCASPAN